MVILLALGSSMIVLIHAITHNGAPSEGAPIVDTIGLQNPQPQYEEDSKLGEAIQKFKEPSVGKSRLAEQMANELKLVKERNIQDGRNPKTNADDKPQTTPKTVPQQQQAPPPPPRKKRTTAEANAYLQSQPSTAVDGEKYIKQQLVTLQTLQQSKPGVEVKAPIMTRFLGHDQVVTAKDGTTSSEKIKYWISWNTSKEDKSKWEKQMKQLDLKKKEEDKILFPSLFGDVPV